MKQVTLTVWERLVLPKCLPPTAPVQQLGTYLRIGEILRVNEEEGVGLGLPTTPGVALTDEMLGIETAVEFEEADYEALVKLLPACEWPVDPRSVVMLAKFGI